MVAYVLEEKRFCYTTINEVSFAASKNYVYEGGRVFSIVSWFCNSLVGREWFREYRYLTDSLMAKHIKVGHL